MIKNRVKKKPSVSGGLHVMVFKFTYYQATPGGQATTIIITNRLTRPHSAVSCLMPVIDFIIPIRVCCKVGILEPRAKNQEPRLEK
jgi:hypothetical protein